MLFSVPALAICASSDRRSASSPLIAPRAASIDSARISNARSSVAGGITSEG